MSVNIRLTELTVCLLPEDSINHHAYAIQVQWRGGETYAVCHFRDCLGEDGTWEFEASPSNRADEWIATHRFSYERAVELAVKAAPDITVNGRSARALASAPTRDAALHGADSDALPSPPGSSADLSPG